MEITTTRTDYPSIHITPLTFSRTSPLNNGSTIQLCDCRGIYIFLRWLRYLGRGLELGKSWTGYLSNRFIWKYVASTAWSSSFQIIWSMGVYNVGIAIINHPCLMVYTTHLWWLGGEFIIAAPTLLRFQPHHLTWILLWLPQEKIPDLRL